MPIIFVLACCALLVLPGSSISAFELRGFLNQRYGYEPKYYGHPPTGYRWPIFGARYPYATRYYLSIPTRPPAAPIWIAEEGKMPLPPLPDFYGELLPDFYGDDVK